MIPKDSYCIYYLDGNEPYFKYVTLEQISKFHTEKEVADFNIWISHQTCPYIDENTSGVYASDYERWVQQGKKQQQGSDWD